MSTADIKGNGTLPAADQQAVAMVMECFGSGSPEALQFAKYVVLRNGLEWLTDEATLFTQERSA